MADGTSDVDAVLEALGRSRNVALSLTLLFAFGFAAAVAGFLGASDVIFGFLAAVTVAGGALVLSRLYRAGRSVGLGRGRALWVAVRVVFTVGFSLI